MRLRYIDLTKGFAIILMLFGHSMIMTNKLHIWIYSFHMPIFFILCGILINMREVQNRTRHQLKESIVRRLYTAGIPYFIFGFLLVGFYSALNILAEEPISLGTRLFKLFTFQGIDSLWFLPIYVFSDIAATGIESISNLYVKRSFKYIFMALTFILACFFQSYMTTWYFDVIFKVMLGVCFIEVGILISKFKIIEKIPLWCIFFLLVIGYILAQVNGEVEMGVAKIGNVAIYFSCAIITSIAITSLFNKFESRKWTVLKYLEEYGKNSIVLLVTNNLIIETIRLLDYKVFGNFLINLDIIGSIILTVFLVGIEWWIIKASKGLLAPIFGHVRKKSK